MSVHDPIADALTVIRNGCRAKKVNDNNHKWKSEDIKAIECAAEDILAAVQQYKSNK